MELKASSYEYKAIAVSRIFHTSRVKTTRVLVTGRRTEELRKMSKDQRKLGFILWADKHFCSYKESSTIG